MDALSFNLCFDTTSMAHRDAVRGERHPLLLGPIRLPHALVPQLLLQPAARMITVSSGLAFVPLAMTPTYSATKAAIRSWTRSLRTQMAGTRIRVHELAPPAVQTGLMPGRRASPHAMPFDAFLDEVMAILALDPIPDEILVQRAGFLRQAEAGGTCLEVFDMLNSRLRSSE